MEVVLGNFAIGRGLLEAGLEVFTAYPGTPSSEILPGVVYFSRKEGWRVYAEWSVNERVAVEVAFGASMAGKNSACAMKQVGFNVALPAFLELKDQPLEGGLVLCIADDPGPISSQTEQDTRLLMTLLDIPVLDPSTPKEAKLFAYLAMISSRAIKTPFCVRPVGKVSHAREAIELGERSLEDPRIKDKGELLEFLTEKGVNRFFEGHGDLALVASGMAFSVAMDVLYDLDLNLPVYKVGSVNPFPKDQIKKALRGYKKVLVLEETDVLIEAMVMDLFPEVLGRGSGDVPGCGELSYDVVSKIILKALGKGIKESKLLKEVSSLNIPPRPPRLCPGCGHRGAFFSAYKVFGKKAIYPGDIGCYTLGIHLGAVDTCLDMGGSVNMASGFSQAAQESEREVPIVASIGDSTFFHSGVDAIVSAKERGYPFILMLLDNRTVAMTGFQPTPETGEDPFGEKRREIPLENLLKALDFEGKPYDPYMVPSLVERLKKGWEKGRVDVILIRKDCLIKSKVQPKPLKYIVEDCTGCKACVRSLDCPALIFDEENKKVRIDKTSCVGCGVCLYACPVYLKERSGEG